MPQRKRSKLVLPAPQVSEGELEELVKLGMAADAGAGDGRPTDGLLQVCLRTLQYADHHDRTIAALLQPAWQPEHHVLLLSKIPC